MEVWGLESLLETSLVEVHHVFKGWLGTLRSLGVVSGVFGPIGQRSSIGTQRQSNEGASSAGTLLPRLARQLDRPVEEAGHRLCPFGIPSRRLRRQIGQLIRERADDLGARSEKIRMEPEDRGVISRGR